MINDSKFDSYSFYAFYCLDDLDAVWLQIIYPQKVRENKFLYSIFSKDA